MASTQQVNYLTQDHLGSPRVITDQNGAVSSRKDFSAFGEETITAERTTGLGYTPPEIRQDYTGYQKDEESGLEFAQARYYNPIHGRFTSVDPLTASATIRNPQTLNRYSYVLNSPYKLADPLGLISESTGACGSRCPNSDYGLGGGGAFDSAGESGGFLDTIREITTTTISVIHREYVDNDPAKAITQEATISVTVTRTRTIETGGLLGDRVIYDSGNQYKTTVSDTGVGGFSQNQKNDLGTTVERIVRVGLETGRSIQAITVFLAKASRMESHLGIGTRGDTSAKNRTDPAMEPMNNPGQIDARSGITPRANDWRFNINASYDHFEHVMQRNFPNKPAMWNASLQDRLRYYNGGPRALQIPSTLRYANQIMATMNLVNYSLTTKRTDLYGLPVR